jgi:hypothetical protein
LAVLERARGGRDGKHVTVVALWDLELQSRWVVVISLKVGLSERAGFEATQTGKEFLITPFAGTTESE